MKQLCPISEFSLIETKSSTTVPLLIITLYFAIDALGLIIQLSSIIVSNNSLSSKLLCNKKNNSFGLSVTTTYTLSLTSLATSSVQIRPITLSRLLYKSLINFLSSKKHNYYY